MSKLTKSITEAIQYSRDPDTMTAAEYIQWRDRIDSESSIAEAQFKHEMSADEYRERYGRTANDELARMTGPEHEAMYRGEFTSTAKTEFEQWLRLTSPALVVAEYEFLPDRKYRADWSIPSLGIVFEYDGVRDHGTRKGSERDAEKSNLAQLAGWLFIRVNANSINDGSGYTVAARAINQRIAARRRRVIAPDCQD